MASYTSDTKLLIELPSSLPSGLSITVRVQYITDASAEVDARVGPRYGLSYGSNTQKFPDITATPATPEVIEQAARLLAAARCYRKLGEINRDASGDDLGSRYETRGRELLGEIRSGEIEVFDSAGTDLSARDPLLSSTMEDVDLEFTKGKYQDGDLMDEDAGTLDEY